MSQRFNIRVYALIIHNDAILITDEFRAPTRMSKFPGGGLDWGEGIADALKRECMEEMGQEPVHMEHFYTTEFFCASAFRADDQLISIYYKVALPRPEEIPITTDRFAFDKEEDGAQTFRWIPMKNLGAEDVTFPIDKFVVNMLIG